MTENLNSFDIQMGVKRLALIFMLETSGRIDELEAVTLENMVFSSGQVEAERQAYLWLMQGMVNDAGISPLGRLMTLYFKTEKGSLW